MGLLQLYKEENGQDLAITIKDSDGAEFSSSWIVEADTTIVIKSRDLKTTKTTVTNSDLAFATPIITWTPTSTQIETDIGKGDWKGFVHLRDNASSREVIAEFDLKILDN